MASATGGHAHEEYDATVADGVGVAAAARLDRSGDAARPLSRGYCRGGLPLRDAGMVDIEADDLKLFTEFNRERRADVAQADDGDSWWLGR